MKPMRTLIAATGFALAGFTPSYAYEFGSNIAQMQPGVFHGTGAPAPPPGIYMFDQVFTNQGNAAGPGTQLLNPNGGKTGTQNAVGVVGFVFVPGWSFLGATYSAVIAQPFVMQSFGSPVNLQASGVHNTYIVPVELSWNLGNTGFFLKAGLGVWVPTGTQTGFNGNGNVGNPWWTFQPEIILSYLNDGWHASVAVYEEFNTKNTITDYQSGDVLHVDFSLTKTIGKWTIGPVVHYTGQVSNDKSSAFYGGAINVNKYDIWAAGGLVGYNFGPASLNVWATADVSAKASGGTPILGIDQAVVPKGFTVFATLTYQVWAPDAPAPTPARMYRK